MEDAQSFVAQFPMLELADGTELPTYQSPHLPFGRGVEWSDPEDVVRGVIIVTAVLLNVLAASYGAKRELSRKRSA